MTAEDATQPGAVPDATTAFHLHEHQHVCKSLDWLVRQFHTYAIYSGIGVVVIFAWLARHEVPDALKPVAAFAWYLPAVLAGALGLAQFAVYREIRIYAGYLRRLELRYAEAGLGFQHGFDGAKRFLGIGWVTGAAMLYSFTLFAGSLVVGDIAARTAQ